jgi:cytochrome P450 family 3 subfamily A
MLLDIALYILAAIVAALLSSHIVQRLKYRHIPGLYQVFPISPWRIPFLASHMYANNVKHINYLSRTVFRNDPVFRVTCVGVTYLFVNSPKAAKHVMVLKASNYPKPRLLYRPIEIFGPNVVSVAGGDAHKTQHSVVVSAFKTKHLDFAVEVTNNSTDILIERIANKGSIEVHEDCTALTMDIIGKTNFGTDLGVFKSESSESKPTGFLEALLTSTTSGIFLFQFVPRWMHTLPMFKGAYDSVMLTKYHIERLIEKRKKEPNHLDLLGMLVEANEGETENKLSTDEMLSNAFIFLLAGHETTAATMGYLLYELAKHQDVQNECVREIERILTDEDGIQRSMTYSDSNSFTYCNNTIKETLRLHTPAAAVAKIAAKEDVICGTRIPEGSFVTIPFHALHLDEDTWENATVFNPRRFEKRHDPAAFMAFSGGIRRCVGEQFSRAETLAIMVRFLQKFRFRLQEGKEDEPLKESQLVTVRIKHLEINVSPRY